MPEPVVAEILPPLLMPPENVERTAVALPNAWPPTKMPSTPAATVPLLRDAAGEVPQRE
jgi:hypothetical protein